MKYVIIGIIVVIAVLVWYLDRRGSTGPTRNAPDAAPGHQYQQLPRDGGIGGG